MTKASRTKAGGVAAKAPRPTNGVRSGRAVPIRTVRIPRPYGGEIVLEAPDVPTIGECYYVPGGTHAPHHPTPEWIAKFRGKFDMGWNALREQIFANQKRLGVIPQDAKLTPWP